jgi:4-oxalocrotonate tautomerase
MPIITYEASADLTAEERQELASRLTEITRQHLRKDPALTVVRMALKPESGAWFVAGRAVTEQHASRLSIQITAGTNTDTEKSVWIRAAAELLGVISQNVPHYLVINEIPGTDWGFNGITQTARKELATWETP